MENASKALIIAGAILISIVIITLGVMIVNNVTGLINNSSNMSEQEVATFNAKFESYEGSQKGANAISLYKLVRSHNSANVDDPTLQITLTISDTEFSAGATKAAATTAPALPTNDLKTGNTYNVTFATDPNSGRITAINIKKK